ncbi:Putative uncharacterized protein [Lacticaseibacillus paracasei]|nr:Putative uncharacterized protein [Lacticaseibacillus paracasei]
MTALLTFSAWQSQL